MNLHLRCWQEWSQWNPWRSWNWRTFNLIGLEIEYYTYKGTGVEVTVELFGLGMNIELILRPWVSDGSSWEEEDETDV